MSEIQVPTRAVRTEWIVSRAAFRSGVEDVRRGRAPRFDDFSGGDAWSYERGRLFAVLAPISMPLKIDGKCNPKAARLYDAAVRRGFIQP
jgi:hypothetical protein